ncbi:unnamed protein product [Nyctereutes procyonoides]|uniref:(raccoon dog) hypothetical protein n=1 Tax=Nyctereutes procyonoides TaxID=34880 RepID=A0A811Y4C0_NYCPR|nr:unnamed protein product [Nyctereutes procyonoides]
MVMDRDGSTEHLMTMKLQAPLLSSPRECWELWNCGMFDSTILYNTYTPFVSRYQESKPKPEFFLGLGGGGRDCSCFGWDLRGISTFSGPVLEVGPTHKEIQGLTGHEALWHTVFP